MSIGLGDYIYPELGCPSNETLVTMVKCEIEKAAAELLHGRNPSIARTDLIVRARMHYKKCIRVLYLTVQSHPYDHE